MRAYSAAAVMVVLAAGFGPRHAAAQGQQFVPAYPLYCKGPLTPTASGAPGATKTAFKWAPAGAGAAAPGAGQCVWADRPARGSEILPGGGNVVCDFSGVMKPVPAGQFLEIGVERDPLVANCMHLSRWVGTVTPPFSAAPALSPFTRQSVAALSAAQIASLRHGIQVMMARPPTDPTSYRFQANIHGTYDPMTTPQQMQEWDQCEHGSFYFLSWHRMYLYFFERILRAAAGDPNLVLPYWNWADPAQRALPAAFRQPADSTNPLYIAPPGRPAALDAGTGQLGAGTVDASVAFGDVAFDSPNGSGESFGGQIASPTQFNSPHGDFESQPHDVVHSSLGGLMGDPNTAGQDPIFWLHHANIDRLWGQWLRQGGGRQDATDATWLNTHFTFYDEAGHAVYLTGSEVLDTVKQLNYRYDDDPMELARKSTPEPRRVVAVSDTEPTAPAVAGKARPSSLLAESAATSNGRIELGGEAIRVDVPLPEASAAQLRAGRSHVLLRLDDVRYEKPDGVYYEVYLNPPDEKPSIRTAGYVGNLSLFGLKPHAMAGHPAPAVSDVFVQYDVSRLVPKLMASNPKQLTIMLVPRGLFEANGEPLPVPQGSKATLGRVRLLTR